MRSKQGNRTEDPFLTALLLEAEQGPPLDPASAVFWHVVRDLLVVLLHECDPRRREWVIEQALDVVKRWLQAATGHRTLEEQNQALAVRELGRVLKKWDRRKGQQRKGPSDFELATEYDAVRRELRDARRRRDPKRALRERFGDVLRPYDLSDLASKATPPSVGAFLVLARRHGLGQESVRKRVSAGRNLLKDLESLRNWAAV